MNLLRLCTMALGAGMVGAGIVAAGIVSAPTPADAGFVTSIPGQSDYYNPMQIRYVAGGGEVWTIVRGNAFRMAKPDFDTAVTSYMDGRPGWVSPAKYTTTPSENAKRAYWVVLVFNPPRSYDGYRACNNHRGAGGPTNDGYVEVVAAFCSRDKVLGESRGTLSRATGPDDPSFAALIRQVQNDIFPYRMRNLGPGIFPD